MVTLTRGPNWKIAVYGREHGVPHFHIEGPNFRCSVGIRSLNVIIGSAAYAGVERSTGMGREQSGGIDDDMEGVKRMSSTDKPRIITSVTVRDASRLHVVWSDGATAEIDLKSSLEKRAFAALRDPIEFATVTIADWGHALEWRCGVELGADSLWLETLSATGRGDVRRFLEWRLHNGLSLSEAATALGISRRSVAYYSNGERAIPKAILLACTGWETVEGLRQAA
jgi:hypothetical protein